MTFFDRFIQYVVLVLVIGIYSNSTETFPWSAFLISLGYLVYALVEVNRNEQ